jgi:hypothetical protein
MIRLSRPRRRAFVAGVGVLTAALGIGFFGLTRLVLGWFESDRGTFIPVTDLGYGALLGILITGGLLVQFRAPEQKIAGLQQATLAILAGFIAAPIAADQQGLVPWLSMLAAVGILVALHPARGEFLRSGKGFSPALAGIAVLGAVPLIGYALSMGAQARELAGPPHHIQRLTTMAAMAIALPLVGVLAAFETRGWRMTAWCVGAAAVVFGLASVVFPNYAGSAGREWGALAIAGGLLFVLVAEWEARRVGRHTPV